MMFSTVGHRPHTQQRIRLGATPEGKLTCLTQDYLNHTSILDDYKENCGEATPFLYSTPNLRVTSGLVRRNVGTPTRCAVPARSPVSSRSSRRWMNWRSNSDRPVELRLRK